MAIKGKLFGWIGQVIPAAAPVSETAQPGYDIWYARQMARSYEAGRRRGPAQALAAILRDALGHDLPLAA